MKTILLLALAALGLASSATAQNHAKASLYARVEGSDVKVAVEIVIEKGWHLYHGPTGADLGDEGVVAKPTTIELKGDGFAWGDWRFPTPEIETEDLGTPLKVNVHNGTMVVWRAGVMSPTAKLEALTATVDGLTCNSGQGGTCVGYDETATFAGKGKDELFAKFPKDLSAKPAPVSAASSSPPSPGTKSEANPTKTNEDAGSESTLFAFLLSAVFWGLFTLLMPCTYPMIPITISYFTKQATARQTSTLPLSLAYGAGIVLIFVVIGLVVGPVIIPFATHPVTNLVIGVVFLVFALTLFGVMNLQPPAFLLNIAGSASQKGGYVGVFLMGATLVVTSFTCTAPFVGTLLSTGATSGGLGRIALGMGVFGLTIAVPFVFLSMVPAKAKSMPKSGEWMHTLKVFLGFVEVAASLKFISNADVAWNWGVLSRELFLVLWALMFFVAAAYLFAWIRLADPYGGEGDPATVRPARMTAGLATALFAAYCLYGLNHSMDQVMTALIPNYSTRIDGGGNTQSAEARPVVIEDDYDAAVERAKRDGKMLFVNFTGFT